MACCAREKSAFISGSLLRMASAATGEVGEGACSASKYRLHTARCPASQQAHARTARRLPRRACWPSMQPFSSPRPAAPSAGRRQAAPPYHPACAPDEPAAGFFTGCSLIQQRMTSQTTFQGASVLMPNGLACEPDALRRRQATYVRFRGVGVGGWGVSAEGIEGVSLGVWALALGVVQAAAWQQGAPWVAQPWLHA